MSTSHDSRTLPFGEHGESGLAQRLRWLAPVGSGTNASVWRARVGASGPEVAVKLLRSRGGPWADLREEARRIASLDHPNIVDVYGVLELPVEDGPPGFDGGAAMIMELATGTAQQLVGDWTLAALSGAVANMLKGLAHLHGHGLVHNDIKPANLLLFTSPDGHDELRWADFAVLKADRDALGTPGFFAPERAADRRGTVRSDICSVALTVAAVASGALTGGPRWHEAGAAVGSRAVSRWLATAGAERPEHRFASAVEALNVWQETVAPTPATWKGPRMLGDPAGGGASTVNVRDRVASFSRTTTSALASSQEAIEPVGTSNAAFPTHPPRTDDLPRPRPRVAAGVEMADVRRVRLIGRAAAADALWTALGQAWESGGGGIVRVDGAPGVGCTRLIEWAASASHEHAGAVVVRLDADAQTPQDMVARVIEQLVQAGVGAATTSEERSLEEELRRGGPVFRNVSSRVAALAGWLRRLAASRRLVVVVLVSTTSGHALIRELREQGAAAVVLADRGATEPGPDDAVVEVAALDERFVRQVVERLLPVENRTAEILARAAGGRVRAAVDWLEGARRQGALVSTEVGYQWPEASRILRAASAESAERTTRRRPSDHALLWLATLSFAGVDEPKKRGTLAPRELQDAEAAGWIRWRSGRWFSVPGTQAQLSDALQERGLAAAALAQADEVVSGRPSDPHDVSRLLGIARLAILAGDQAAALARLRPLLLSPFDSGFAQDIWDIVAATPESLAQPERTLLLARSSVALGDIERAGQSMQALAHNPGDLEARLATEELRVVIALSERRTDDARAAAAALSQVAAMLGDPIAVARAALELARVEIISRRGRAAIDALDAASAAVSHVSDELRFRLGNMRTNALLLVGDAESAYANARSAFEEAEGALDPFMLGNCANDLGDACVRFGRLDEAADWYARGIELVNDRFPMAAYLHANLAFIDIRTAQLGRAERRLQAALARLPSGESLRVRALLEGLLLAPLASTARREEWWVMMTTLIGYGPTFAAFSEVAEAAECASERWALEGAQTERSESMLLAATIWDSLGEHDRAAACRVKGG